MKRLISQNRSESISSSNSKKMFTVVNSLFTDKKCEKMSNCQKCHQNSILKILGAMSLNIRRSRKIEILEPFEVLRRDP